MIFMTHLIDILTSFHLIQYKFLPFYACDIGYTFAEAELVKTVSN